MPGQSLVTQTILNWSEEHPRDLPWKETRDPYRIWVSEIMLQQTQVAQGIEYYHRFLKRFPSVHDLAGATEDEVLLQWQGLGYNSRARNLHQAAKTIVSTHGGVFPENYDDILALKGIGEYTAAAVGSFAFDLAVPVLDTNVIRLLCRLYGIVDSPVQRKTRDQLYTILDDLMANTDPARFNQAIMDFGALQCRARNPLCEECPLSERCIALKDDMVSVIPVKPPKKPRRKRYLHYFLLRNEDGVVITRRMSRDIWEKMFEFPLIETGSTRMPARKLRMELFENYGIRPAEVRRIGTSSQILTHQEIVCIYYELGGIDPDSAILPAAAHFELFQNLENFALPKVIRTFLKDIFHSKYPQG